MSAADPRREARRQRRRTTLGRLAFATVIVLAMASVVWRWTVGEDRFGELERLREEIRVAQAEKADLQGKILELQRRERITRIARDRLGMHVARDDEIVLLPVPASGTAGDSGDADGSTESTDRGSDSSDRDASDRDAKGVRDSLEGRDG